MGNPTLEELLARWHLVFEQAGKRLLGAVKAAGSQAELARRVGTSRQHLFDVLNGDRQPGPEPADLFGDQAFRWRRAAIHLPRLSLCLARPSGIAFVTTEMADGTTEIYSHQSQRPVHQRHSFWSSDDG
jgi:hypothetical protein